MALQQFLRFLYSPYRTRLSFWADLCPILFDRPYPELEKEFKRVEASLLSRFELEECLDLQRDVRERFKKMLDEAKKPQGYELTADPQRLYLLKWPSVGEAYWVGTQFDLYDPGEPLQVNILRRVAEHLRGLRREALRVCEQCSHFFIQGDVRPARFCSRPCRVEAANWRRKEKKLAHAKRRRRG